MICKVVIWEKEPARDSEVTPQGPFNVWKACEKVVQQTVARGDVFRGWTRCMVSRNAFPS
jgi:hypothetical protein